MRQQADVGDMIWSVPEIIAALSELFELQAGDLIYTGTPAGVGPLQPGDRVEGGIEGLESLRNTIIAAA
jgi:fumarylpyruvate hydrolase